MPRARLIAILASLLWALVGVDTAEAVVGACGGRHLPSNKIRRVRNIRLECTSAVDHYIRTPIPFDVNAWREAELDRDRNEMQRIGQDQPLIRWSGSIPYETVERWEWTNSEYGADPSCGYTTTEHRNSDGTTYTTTTMNSCWHDVNYSESRHCSAETMPYTAEFVRPPLTEWSPRTDGYFDVLPNKYDLLPGEVEDVQIFTNRAMSTIIRPALDIGDAWNEYNPDLQLDTGGHAACRMNTTYRLTARIHTNRRLRKQSPNAFRTPVDQFGRERHPFEWEEGMNSRREWVRSRPLRIQLVDASEVLIASLARQSRQFTAELAQARQENGQGRSTSTEALRNHESRARENGEGFWKDTKVRIRFYRDEPLARDVRVSPNLYTDASNSATSRGQYRMELEHIYRASGPFFQNLWAQLPLGLVPERHYYYLISMYQKGVPFYAQDCEDPTYASHWNCRLGLRSENSWYSKELQLDFNTDRHYDDRIWLQRLSDFQGKPIWRKIHDLFRW